MLITSLQKITCPRSTVLPQQYRDSIKGRGKWYFYDSDYFSHGENPNKKKNGVSGFPTVVKSFRKEKF